MDTAILTLLLVASAVCVTSIYGDEQSKTLGLYVLPENTKYQSQPQFTISAPPNCQNVPSTSRPVTMEDLMHKPVMLALPDEDSDDEMVVYLCHKGLSSPPKEANTLLFDSITHNQTKAIAFDPSKYAELRKTIPRTLRITRSVISRDLNLATYTHAMEGKLPWILIYNLVGSSFQRIGSFDIQEDTVEVLRDNHHPVMYLGTTQLPFGVTQCSGGCPIQIFISQQDAQQFQSKTPAQPQRQNNQATVNRG